MKFYTIFDVIKKMNESSEEMTILKYENMMSVMFASPILFFGAIANFLSSYFIFNRDLTTTAINSFILLGFSIVFVIILSISNNERFKSNIFAFLFSALLVFVVIRYYFLIGPAVWTISLILVMNSNRATQKNHVNCSFINYFFTMWLCLVRIISFSIRIQGIIHHRVFHSQFYLSLPFSSIKLIAIVIIGLINNLKKLY